MINLIRKEITLVISPFVYLFFLCSAMLLIPAYPYWVGMFYCLLAVQITFSVLRANKDQEFTAILPIPRKHVVFSKCFDVIFIEVLQIIVAIPFAIISTFVLYPNGNLVGMDANFAFFGFVLVVYTVFNLIFLPWYFKTGYKVGIPFAIGLVGYLVCVLVIEAVVNLVPQLKLVLDGHDASTMVYRLIVLVGGILIFIFGNMFVYKISNKNFDKINL